MTYNRRHVQHFARRIKATFHAATDAQLAEGMAWYNDARDYCRALAAEFGVSLETAAGIVAVLSPSTEWNLNKRRARAILEGANGGMMNWERAVRIREGEAFESVVKNGPKITAFYRAILGDESSIVIDRHAHDVAVGKVTDDRTRKILDRAGQYALFVDAYDRVANEVGVTPVALQAITWTVWRTTESAYSQRRSSELVAA